MYYLGWAGKNIRVNLPKYAVMLSVMAFVSSILFLFDAVYSGYGMQVQLFQRVVQGDVSLVLRQGDLSGGMEALLSKADAEISLESYLLTDVPGRVSLITEGGNSSISITGIPQAYLDGRLSKHMIAKEGSLSVSVLNTCLIDADTAGMLGLRTGDTLAAYYRNADNHIVTKTLTVRGIFIANKYVQSRILYCSTSTASGFLESKSLVNRTIFLLESGDRDSRLKVAYRIKAAAADLIPEASVASPIEEDSDFSFFQTMDVFRVLIGLLRSMVTVVLFLILFLEIQNSYYLVFNKRNKEIATLLTYGMGFAEFFKIILSEAVILNAVSAIIAVLLSVFFVLALSGYPIALLSENLLVVFGGPYIRLSYDAPMLIRVLCFVLIASVTASTISLFRYLKRDVSVVSAEGL